MNTKKLALITATDVMSGLNIKKGMVQKLDANKAQDSEGTASIIEVSFENILGNPVLFTVTHRNKIALKGDIADMPFPLQSTRPKLRVVSAPAEAHFKLKEWVKLCQLSTPGAWYYLATPKAYRKAEKIYAKIDPIGRVFGIKPKAKKT